MFILPILSIVFYVLGTMILFVSIKEHYFTEKKKISVYFRILFFCFICLGIIYFFGLYQPEYTDFHNIFQLPLVITLILTLIVGSAIYLLFMKVFTNHINNYFNERFHFRKVEFTAFVFIILFFMSIFTFQTNSVVKQDNYNINAYSTSFSADYSKISYLVADNNKPYVIIRNLENPYNYTIYSLGDLPCQTNLNNVKCDSFNMFYFLNSGYYQLKYFEQQGLILIVNNPEFGTYKYFVLDINKKIVTEIFGGNYLNPEVINSNITFINPTNTTPCGFLTYYKNNLGGGLYNGSNDLKTCYFSPNYSKLIVIPSNTNNNKSEEIDFYSISNGMAHIVYNMSLLGSSGSMLRIIQWPSNNTVYFSYFTYSSYSTTIFSFNFTNSKENVIGKISGEKAISSINMKESFFSVMRNLDIYSITNGKLLLNSSTIQDLGLWESSTNIFIGFNGNDLLLMKYDGISNTLIILKVLDSPNSKSVIDFYNNLLYLNLAFLIITLVSLAIVLVKDKGYNTF